jgi:hypothetical protein
VAKVIGIPARQYAHNETWMPAARARSATMRLGERIEVDRAIGLLRRDCADRHHQRRAAKRNAGAIEAEPGNAFKRNARISQKKDYGGDDC